MRKSLYSAGALLSVGAIALTGCTPNSANNASGGSGGTADGSISVTSTDTECKLSATEVKAGKVTFKVKNEGSKVTEFYVLGSDGLRIISEVENIGPNLSRDLTVELPEGSYKTACKPGMVGDGIKGDLKVVKNESAKILMCFWCLFAFITTGFEHSIANMTLLTSALLVPAGQAVSVNGWFFNLAAVTLGNIIGGAVFVALPYYVVSRKK